MVYGDIICGVSLLAWIGLGFFRGRFWSPLIAPAAARPEIWPSVDIIVPARNETEVLPGSLPSLITQNYPGIWRIIFVDDNSTDHTAEMARRLAKTKDATDKLMLVTAPDLTGAWTGKLSAMNAGVVLGTSEYILFTDADIYHPPGNLRDLMARACENKLDLTSQMARLHCVDFAEKLLIPAFVFFFGLLYPFRRANDPQSRVAAAAGGVMLVKRDKLKAIGGLNSIKSALIDDCALAQVMKDNGGRIDLSMTQKVLSLRSYAELKDVWQMVARTAFTQLNHSALALAAMLVGMGILFLVPIVAVVMGNLNEVRLGGAAWFAMTAIYLPMIRFYRLPLFWAVMLPVAGLIFAGATIDSARRYWHGKAVSWRGRSTT